MAASIHRHYQTKQRKIWYLPYLLTFTIITSQPIGPAGHGRLFIVQFANCEKDKACSKWLSIEEIIDNNVLQIAQTAVTTGTRMFVNSLARERYPINYIYGFESEGFSYFLTSQMRHTSPSPYHSKLVRVCHDDSDYYSYTEIPIECISGGNPSRDYNLVQARAYPLTWN